jgi:membrane protein DedA with SNARE-associated domain
LTHKWAAFDKKWTVQGTGACSSNQQQLSYAGYSPKGAGGQADDFRAIMVMMGHTSAMRGERKVLTFVIAAFAVISVGSGVGMAFAPTLLAYSPLGLIALNPSGQHLLLAATATGLFGFVAVAVLRRTLASLLAYQMGSIYGDRALEWAKERFPRYASLVNRLEASFYRAGLPLLFVAPGLTFAGLAGVTGMPFWIFLITVLAGQTAWMTAVYYFGEAHRESLVLVVTWLTQYMVEATLVSILFVAAYEIYRRRSGRSAVLQELDE